MIIRDIAVVLAVGGAELGRAALEVFPWTAAAVFLGWLLWHLPGWLTETYRAYGQRYERPALPAAAPCPCCTGLYSDDCTCREDCGVTQCQAADPDGLDLPDWVRGEGGRG